MLPFLLWTYDLVLVKPLKVRPPSESPLDHLDVCTDHIQRSLIMIKTIPTEGTRKRTSPPPTLPLLYFMASITQCDGVSMNNAVVPLHWPGVSCMCDIKERRLRVLVLIIAELKKGQKPYRN